MDVTTVFVRCKSLNELIGYGLLKVWIVQYKNELIISGKNDEKGAYSMHVNLNDFTRSCPWELT